MRTAYKMWSGVAATTFVLVAIVDLSSSDGRDPQPAASTASSSYSQPVDTSWYGSAPPGSPDSTPYAGSAQTAPTALGGQAAGITRVIDGDTFEIAGGDEVRVLGIDSCEMSTDRGPDAKADAEMWLSGGQVTLTREPGVDRDRYGRLLRYVSLAGGTDFGEQMVSPDHTAVYEGGNAASAERLSDLRTRDYSGRECSEPEPYVPPVDEPDPDPSIAQPSDDDSDDAPKRRTGSSGHLCGPGERDGDGDGYCGEGR